MKGKSFGQEDLQQMQSDSTQGRVRVLCENTKHKQRQAERKMSPSVRSESVH